MVLALLAGSCAPPPAQDPPEPSEADAAATVTPTRDAAARAPTPDVNAMPQADAAPPLSGGPDAAPDQASAPADAMMVTGTEGDEPPDRPLAVDKSQPQSYSFKFKPSDADPMASARDETQTAAFNSGAPKIRGKLMVVLSGFNGTPGPLGLVTYGANLGYHAIALAYNNGLNPSGQNDPKLFGDFRLEQFDGMDHTPRFTVSRPDCVEVRVAKAMAYLQTKNAAGDWAYYLKKDGTVRWSDVIFIGHSHGSSSAPRYAKVRRVWRSISLSGPRDTNPVTAAWLSEPSMTPIDRYYGFTGTGDAQHQDHLKAMEAAGYLGAVVDVANGAPTFGGSHRLKYNGGHGGSASCNGAYDAVCKYMLGAD
jgi:hypothetical protein